MLLWYNFIIALLVFGVLLLLWCSNIIATIPPLTAVLAVLALWVSAARIWFLHQCASLDTTDAVDVCGASASLNHHNAPGSYQSECLILHK
jgi:hypothetical protein